MKRIVIYYSQTGNTRKVAKAIRKGMEQNAGQCDIAHIKDLDPADVDHYDLIGLGQFFGYSPLQKAASEAIASGRLRKLVPDEIEGPYFKVYSKRPRFKIPKDE